MNNESNKIRINIPKVEERFDLWAQMQGLAQWIFEITEDWWNSDEELRKFAGKSYEKHDYLKDDPYNDLDDRIYSEIHDPEDDVPY